MNKTTKLLFIPILNFR